MRHVWVTLAKIDVSALRTLQRSSPARNEIGFVLAAIGIVVVAVLVWAIFIRKREDATARRYREHFSSSGSPPPPGVVNDALDEQRPRRKKKRRREHRQRNPTLAETGGLPPLRDHLQSQDDPP